MLSAETNPQKPVTRHTPSVKQCPVSEMSECSTPSTQLPDSPKQTTTISSMPSSVALYGRNSKSYNRSMDSSSSNVPYFLYALVVALMLLYFLIQLVPRSTEVYHKRWETSARIRFSEGWWILKGRPKDESDFQWREYTNSLGLLTGATLLYIGLDELLRCVFRNTPRRVVSTRFYALFGLFFAFYIHSSTYVIPLTVLGIVYVGTTSLIRNGWGRYALCVTWVWSIVSLYLFNVYGPYLSLQKIIGRHISGLEGTPRYLWFVAYNFYILRMISFVYDHYEAFSTHQEMPNTEKSCIHNQSMTQEETLSSDSTTGMSTNMSSIESKVEICSKCRVCRPRPLYEYNFVSYLAYVTYFPLYLAGPIMTFNAWSSCTSQRISRDWRKLALYAFRIVILYVSIEFSLHFLYVNALRETPTRKMLQWSCAEFMAVCFFTLSFLWQKFAFIWRLSRLLALLNGMDVPENMLRCFADTYLVSEFWKSWHASFNRWMVRYMYIPMGGHRTKYLSVWVIFCFVAIWHEISLWLFEWAGIMALLMMPEFLLRYLSSSVPWFKIRVVDVLEANGWLTHVVSALCGINVAALIFANSIGYGLGADHVPELLTMYLSLPNVPFLFMIILTFFCVAKLVLRVRELESISM